LTLVIYCCIFVQVEVNQIPSDSSHAPSQLDAIKMIPTLQVGLFHNMNLCLLIHSLPITICLLSHSFHNYPTLYLTCIGANKRRTYASSTGCTTSLTPLIVTTTQAG